MNKLASLCFCSLAASFVLSTSTAFAGYLIPRVPPAPIVPPAKAAGEALYTPMSVATLRTVTNVNDDGPGSLRAAIAASTSGDSIDFDLTLPATIVLSNTLTIATDLAILGPGPGQLTVMRSSAPGTPEFRVFEVETGAVTIAGMTIRNGSAFSGTNLHDNLGGGILNHGNLTVSNCVVTANRAPTTDWGASFSPRYSVGFGAGIFADQGSELTVIDSTISDNHASGAAGGLYTWHALQFLVSRSTINGNSADVQGGGINIQGQAGLFQNSTISGNSTPPEGAASALLLITFPGETATLGLTACTVAGNVGSTNGAVILAGLPGNAGLTNQLLSTLAANNVGGNFLLDGNPVLISLGNNLDSDGSSGLVNGLNGDIVGTAGTPVDPLLGPLQNNGGPTSTMALLPGSPAIDAGSCLDASGAPLLADQRGVTRPQGVSCDVGAYEFQPLTLNCPPEVVAEFMNETGAVVTFTITANDSCPGVVIVATRPSGSVFPIGVTPVLVQATDDCTNSAQCSFDVIVLGAQGVKSNVLAELTALAAATNYGQPFDQKLDDAIACLAASLNPAYWIDQTHLQPKLGNTAMNQEKLAVSKLDDLRRSKQSPVDAAVLQDFIDRIVKSDRLLAVVSIQDAASAGLNPKKIAQDWAMVAKGDLEAAAGRYENAIEQYRNAWRHALQLRLQVTLHPSGSAVVRFIGNNSKAYVIESSADMVHWAPVGTCSADKEGNVEFTDATAGAGVPRFYRAVEQ